MKALILGATGFIGGHIFKSALQSGWEVIGFRRNPQSKGHIDTEIVWKEGNLTNYDSLCAAMTGVDVVFHAAAYYPTDGNPRIVPRQIRIAQNEIQTVLNAAKTSGVKKFIYTSTLTTIGTPPPGEDRLPDERDVYRQGSQPKSAYYETKIVMEKAVLAANSSAMPCIILNPTAVFGPGDVHLTMGSILIAIAKGYGFAWFPGTINIVDVRDVADAHIRAAVDGIPGERYILGGHNHTIRELLGIVASIAGKSPPRFEIPLTFLDFIVWLSDCLPFLQIPTNHLRTIREWQGYNTAKAQRELSLHPRPVEETIRDALTWFRENKYL